MRMQKMMNWWKLLLVTTEVKQKLHTAIHNMTQPLHWKQKLLMTTRSLYQTKIIIYVFCMGLVEHLTKLNLQIYTYLQSKLVVQLVKPRIWSTRRACKHAMHQRSTVQTVQLSYLQFIQFQRHSYQLDNFSALTQLKQCNPYTKGNLCRHVNWLQVNQFTVGMLCSYF